MATNTGSFIITGTYGFTARVTWEQNYDSATKLSSVAITKMEINSATYSGNWYLGGSSAADGYINIDGTQAVRMSYYNPATHLVSVTAGEEWFEVAPQDSYGDPLPWIVDSIEHADEGDTTVDIEVNIRLYSPSVENTYPVLSHTETVTLELGAFVLSISEGNGCKVIVDRISSQNGSTGLLTDGDAIYSGDELTISFETDSGLELITNTVNGEPWTSGDTLTVSSDVAVVAEAQTSISSISATDAAVGEISTITIKRQNSSYTYTLRYEMGSVSGTIVENTSLVKVEWTVPEDLYAEMQETTSGKCTIICETFNGEISLGTSSCQIDVSLPIGELAPDIVCTVVDIDETTTALTGNVNAHVRWRSDLLCTVVATPKNGATITSIRIHGTDVDVTNNGDGTYTGSKTLTDFSASYIVVYATDSRGYRRGDTLYPEPCINYTKLTINPVITRVNPTTKEVTLSFDGRYFNGDFGAYHNTLSVRWKYKKENASEGDEEAMYCEWREIDPLAIEIATETYRTQEPVLLDGAFEYRTAYTFQVQAVDGASGIPLSTVTKTLSVHKGEPVFDWGENDFNVNGDFKIKHKNIYELIYPVGSVFITTEWDALPPCDEGYRWILIGEQTVSSEIEGAGSTGISYWKKVVKETTETETTE